MYHVLSASIHQWQLERKPTSANNLNLGLAISYTTSFNNCFITIATIATCQLNISQHSWAQHVVCVWPPFCDMLRHVVCSWLKCDHCQTSVNNSQHVATHRNILLHSMLCAFDHPFAICCDMLCVLGSNMTTVKLQPTTASMSQHIATRWPNAHNMLRSTTLRYV